MGGELGVVGRERERDYKKLQFLSADYFPFWALLVSVVQSHGPTAKSTHCDGSTTLLKKTSRSACEGSGLDAAQLSSPLTAPTARL